MSTAAITEELLGRVTATLAAGELPLVVFDLDGTLYSNTPRIIRILHEFAHIHAAAWPDLFEIVDAIPAQAVKYRVDDTLLAAGIDDEVILAAAHQFWRERFFTNDYVVYDLPSPGAVEFAQLIWRAGGMPVYLTGRDAPNMLIGTLKALQRDGFPIGTVRTQLILKEDPELADVDYKASVVRYLKQVGQVIGLFDNEPALCNLFQDAFADATVVWLDKPHAANPPPLYDRIHVVKQFTDLLPRGARRSAPRG